MAENKKSFILYADQIEMWESLSDEQAGKLMKHIIKYVNDLNPTTDDQFVKLAFSLIKPTLKRDLQKWDEVRSKRADAGRIGGLKSGQTRQQNEANEANASNAKQNEANEAVSVNVNVNVNDTVNANVTANENEKNKYRKLFLSKIVEADLDEDMKTYFKIAVSFQELFKKIVNESGGTTSQLEKATGKWIDDIRLMVESDKIEIEKIRQVWGWLPKSDFWKKNIQSTATLRKQFNKLIIESNHERTKANNGGISESNQEILRRGAERIFAKIDERDRKLSGEQI